MIPLAMVGVLPSERAMMESGNGTTFAVQYLESSPGVAAIAPGDARDRLRAACMQLPISLVLLGWDLPRSLVLACREEADRAGAQLYRWHPLLTGDGTFFPRPEWRTIGLDGAPVPGFRGLPEFTFVCPNRPEVRQAALQRLQDVTRGGDYEGVFLDRIRYPSPAADPSSLLSCFCDDCQRVARDEGLDLAAARASIRRLIGAPEGALLAVRTLLDPLASVEGDPGVVALQHVLRFRMRSVARFVGAVADLIRNEGLAVGLDCFSPALTAMVGQDLGTLDPACDWIKIMTYGHALGPAGLPFELLNLVNWLIAQRSLSEAEALEWVSLSAHLALPKGRGELRKRGLAPEALGAEIKRAIVAGASVLLAGIELVEIEGVAQLNREQIAADLRALHSADVDGLVLSWDLWHIPLGRLELVRAVWGH